MKKESNSCADFHIIYSINTRFEFVFFREGISGKNKLAAVLLYKNVLIRRCSTTDIADDANHLFIETATNFARIACIYMDF